MTNLLLDTHAFIWYDYIDFLIWKDSQDRSTTTTSLDSTAMIESGFADYLSNLEKYETRLVNGEIKW